MQTQSGHGQLVILAGEPGIGKTRLAEHLASRGRTQDVLVLWGRCHEGEGAPAFWPWVQIIRTYLESVAHDVLQLDLGDTASVIAQVVPEIGRRLPGLPPPIPQEPEQARFRFFDGMARFFRNVALRRPLALIIDDLHWADRSSLALLSYVAREIRDSRIVVVGTYRNTEMAANQHLAESLAELSRSPGFQRHLLSGLTVVDVRRLVADATQGQPDERVVSAVYERTEGNPFFVREVIRLLLMDGGLSGHSPHDAASVALPVGVTDVIGQRLSRLCCGCNEILAAASAIGREFSLNVLEPISALDRIALLDGLGEVLQAGLIEHMSGSVGRFRFSHVLIRDTIYEGLSLAQRAALHQRIGETLERLHGSEIDPYLTDLAYHFLQAIPTGDTSGQAVNYAIRAGDRATTQLAYAEAIAHYERALDVLNLGGPTGGEITCLVLLSLGEAHNHAGQFEEAQKAFERAASTARQHDLPAPLARAALGAAGLGIIGHTSPRHVELLEEAVKVLHGLNVPLRARVLARLAFAIRGSSTQDRRRTLVNEAECIARRCDDPSTLLYVLVAGHWGLWMPGNLDERLSIATEIIGLCAQTAETSLIPTAHAHRLFISTELGDIPAVDATIKTFTDLAQELGQPQRLWLAASFKTMRTFMAGCFGDAERCAVLTRTIGEQPAPVLARDHYFVHMLLLRREQGRLGELSAEADEIDRRYATDIFWQSLLTILDSDLNREREALQRLGHLVAAIERHCLEDPRVVVAAAVLSSTPLVQADRDTAALFYSLLRPYAGRNAVGPASMHCFGPMSHCLGVLATTLSDMEEAQQHFEDAIEMSRRMGTPVYLAHSHVALAQILVTRSEPGDQDRARQLMRDAFESAKRLGMCALERRIRDLNSASGWGE